MYSMNVDFRISGLAGINLLGVMVIGRAHGVGKVG